MPAIRDNAIAYAAAATSITVPMCDYLQNDLLIFFVICDAVSTYTTPSGWSVIPNFPSANTVQSNGYYKIAGASEADVAITGTTSDTQCACVIAIRDVNTANPFGATPITSVTTHTAVSRFALPSITTNVADSLILYFASAGGSSTSAPPLGVSIVEGKVNQLMIVDGTSEGMAVGWSFQRATGATPSDIYCYQPAFATYGVGSIAALQIAAPATGATVIPPYMAADGSQLLEHNSGTAAYDGNTAMAATADTNFGTSITVDGSARTIGDATVAAAADVGINTFHSMNGLTNVASAYMSGANVVLASTRYNIGTRNVLAHFRATTPANNQRLSPIAGYRGCWLGLKSSATATQQYKIWQVHGADAPWGAGATIPCIVNCANTDNIAVSGTGSLTNTDVRYVGFWVGGLGALTTQMCAGPVWAMGTTVIAGGNAAEPITIPGIVRCAADGKERLSSLLQGANQMLCMQYLQFGDGGTNTTNLKVNGAAVEFPKRRSVSLKIAYYNGIDDSVGWVFYPGSTDTIDIANTSFTSENKFYFGLHASASTSAAYNFSGAVVSGAGTIALARAITLDSLTINGYGTLDISGLTLTNSILKGMPATSASVTTSASSNINHCAINTSPVTAGNWWWSGADPSIFSYCNFTGGGGHALNCTAVDGATVTLTGNQFTGFGADGSTGAAIYFTATTGAITLAIAGGGNTPTYKTAGATITISNPKTLTFTGLQTGSDIMVKTSDTNTAVLNIDQNASSSYAYNHNLAGTVVDILVMKAGFMPYVVYGYTLPSAASTDFPVAQTIDRNFS